jgi:mitogen-activated protein kinase 15
LCDFGLVRSLTHEESEQLILSEDVATRWYRSPEMLLGSDMYDWATDVWSVGCILAELIIGEPLLMGGSNIEQLEKILELTGIPKAEDVDSIKSKVG